MLTEQWQLGLVVAAIVANALLVVRAYRLAERRAAVAATGDAAVDPEAGVVECPRCRTDNEYGYRYCRSCVGELPGPMDFSRVADSPLGRLSR